MITSKPTVDALLFDLGNVVVDIDFTRVFAAWARDAGTPHEAIAQRFVFDDAYQAHELGKMEGARYFAALRAALGVPLSDEQFVTGWNAVFVEVRKGMPELLQTLAARMPLYVLSNTNALHHAYWSEAYRDVLRHFTQIFCSHELGLRKPSAEAFHRVAETIGVVPSRLAFFDDTAENVEGARRAGLIAFHVTSLPQLLDVLMNELHLPPEQETRG